MIYTTQQWNLVLFLTGLLFQVVLHFFLLVRDLAWVITSTLQVCELYTRICFKDRLTVGHPANSALGSSGHKNKLHTMPLLQPLLLPSISDWDFLHHHWLECSYSWYRQVFYRYALTRFVRMNDKQYFGFDQKLLESTFEYSKNFKKSITSKYHRHHWKSPV